jgi:hypothetical protein
MPPRVPGPGISRSGADTEALFRSLTGATEVGQAALGDALLDGHYVEVKHATSPTLNQVRAVKYITLVAFSVPGGEWYVIPAFEIVRQCAAKKRGQHTENPFESATLSLRNLQEYRLEEPREMKRAVLAAIEDSERYGQLSDLMTSVLDDSKSLAERSVSYVRSALADLGLR